MKYAYVVLKVTSLSAMSATSGQALIKMSNVKCQMSNVYQSKTGFTLLELLVVISIIVILMTLGLSSFSTAQQKGRDAKRKSDIKEVQTALEQYYSVCGYQYPDSTNFYSQGIICTSPSIAIMPTIPSDPRGTTPYFCGPTPGSSNCTSTGFTICAMLETETPNAFCVNNQQ